MKNFKLTNKAKKTFMVSATVVLGSLNVCYIYENNNYETNNDNATINQEDKFNIFKKEKTYNDTAYIEHQEYIFNAPKKEKRKTRRKAI